MKVAEGSFILCYQHLRSRSPKVSLGRLTGLCILTWVNSSLTKHRSSNNTETTSSCSTDSHFSSLEQKFSFFAPVFLSSPLPDITASQPQKLFSFTSWISLTLSLRGNRNDLPCARSLVLLPWFLVGALRTPFSMSQGGIPSPQHCGFGRALVRNVPLAGPRGSERGALPRAALRAEACARAPAGQSRKSVRERNAQQAAPH